MSHYGAPIPPLEPRPGPGDPPAPPVTPVTGEELRRALGEQRAEIQRLRTRSNWSLLFAFLAALGSCQGATSTDSQLRNDVQDTRISVEQLDQRIQELDQQVGRLDREPPGPARPSN